MNNEKIKESGLKELAEIGLENENINEWKNLLLDYKFNDAYPDDKYVWLTNVLALKGVDSGNFGVGCILVDFHGNVVVQGHNEVFNPYFRSGGMVREKKNLPQFWLDLYEGKVFSQARCSQELINAANEIFLLNVDELIENVKKLHTSGCR